MFFIKVLAVFIILALLSVLGIVAIRRSMMLLFDDLDYKSKIFIDKGFSDEKKYQIRGNNDYLLKISPLSYAIKK
ncbi:hypothetical protein [Streptococcus sp. CSL10205-OR2]|uniref:hypothetical protein n=1 Tax=Streptococcus sp. CSL10205-OR2 TaxID=2980558 RepID=UPI0021D83C27|nr:hypothetical protein [Streptococcus sp. CSL10205-OR2]